MYMRVAASQALKKSGRKLFDGKPLASVLQKLDEAFMFGASDLEACIYAGISKTALYAYQEKNPEFQERKQALKNMPTLRAKKTIVDRLDKNVALAQWWLMKRKRDEFGDRIEAPVVNITNLSEKAKALIKRVVPAEGFNL